MKELSNKPYLIRAIYEWCVDSGSTPYLAVRVDANTRVPMEYVKNGEIVLNVSPDATHNLTIGNDLIQFSARFSGVSRELSIPVAAVSGIFAKENTQGLFFPPAAPGAEGEPPLEQKSDQAGKKKGAHNHDSRTPPSSPGGGKPKLQVIK